MIRRRLVIPVSLSLLLLAALAPRRERRHHHHPGVPDPRAGSTRPRAERDLRPLVGGQPRVGSRRRPFGGHGVAQHPQPHDRRQRRLAARRRAASSGTAGATPSPTRIGPNGTYATRRPVRAVEGQPVALGPADEPGLQLRRHRHDLPIEHGQDLRGRGPDRRTGPDAAGGRDGRASAATATTSPGRGAGGTRSSRRGRRASPRSRSSTGWIPGPSRRSSRPRRRPSGLATNRSGGHTHGLRVRARDGAGNVGAWSPEMRIWVP